MKPPTATQESKLMTKYNGTPGKHNDTENRTSDQVDFAARLGQVAKTLERGPPIIESSTDKPASKVKSAPKDRPASKAKSASMNTPQSGTTKGPDNLEELYAKPDKTQKKGAKPSECVSGSCSRKARLK